MRHSLVPSHDGTCWAGEASLLWPRRKFSGIGMLPGRSSIFRLFSGTLVLARRKGFTAHYPPSPPLSARLLSSHRSRSTVSGFLGCVPDPQARVTPRLCAPRSLALPAAAGSLAPRPATGHHGAPSARPGTGCVPEGVQWLADRRRITGANEPQLRAGSREPNPGPTSDSASLRPGASSVKWGPLAAQWHFEWTSSHT